MILGVGTNIMGIIHRILKDLSSYQLKIVLSWQKFTLEKVNPNDSARQVASSGDRGTQKSNSVLPEHHLVVTKHQVPNLIVDITVRFCFPHQKQSKPRV